MPDRPTALVRRLNLPMMVLYGLGTTIGAGIYALIGEVAGTAGMRAPLAFVIASVLAAFTALTFAELCSRFPMSAGEAVYANEAFGRRWLATLVGLLVVTAGAISAATITNAFVGYFAELIAIPRMVSIAGFALLLGAIAAWGIRESVGTAAILTVIETAGLLIVIWGARDAFGELPARAGAMLPPLAPSAWLGILSASLLAFYAFIGFEDMVNVAEEVRDVERTMPAAIVVTLVATTVVYTVLATAAVLSVPPAELAASDAPLAFLFERTTGRSSTFISVVSILAMINGALIQVVMASRIVYGLASQRWIPSALGYVHPRTRTPTTATMVVTAVVLLLALWFPLAKLAAATSIVTLVVFALVDAALLRIKRRTPRPEGVRVFPSWVPAAGLVVSTAFLLYGLVDLLRS